MLLISSKRVIALGLALSAVAITGCGDDEETTSSASAPTESAAAAPPEGKKITVGLVTDIGGLNDRSFNSLANKGLEDAKSELGVEGRVITSKSNSDYVPNLTQLARQKTDLIVGVGFLMAEAINTVATKFPEQNFAIIDFPQAGLKDTPENVKGLLFKENEAGYLAGTLAGLYAEKNGIDTISSVGGQKIPPVDGYIAGFQAGAKEASPGIKTLNAYSQDFVDQAKCKELALDQIDRGSGIVFQVAGQCGLGALDAAKEKDKLGIGVDADQSFLGDYILTSAEKKIDIAVKNTIMSVQDDSFMGGTDEIFDAKSDGVGLGEISAAGQEFAAQIDEVKTKIAAGEIDIPTEVK
ncbi:MAG: BMP family ABC transporter substrate-binding protein [Solirubrobacterales bacterium]|nr:BMP family ABC transporter substrate-binding protein [Solirubrobacterales bacterium]